MEFQCVGCQAILRVEDRFIGRQTQCPKCQAVQRVLSARDQEAGLRTEENANLGNTLPGETSEAEQGAAPGSNGNTDSKQQSPHDSGDELELTGSAGAFFDARIQADAQLAEEEPVRASPVSPEEWAERLEQTFQRPHRASINVVFAVLGLLCSCPLLAIAAWVMSSKDLTAMQEGKMDPAGRDRTRFAYYLGLAGSMFWIVVSFCVTLYLLISSGS